MNYGSLIAYIDKMLFYGSAGVGKTCTRNIIAGDDPPDTRNSTPLATRPVNMYQVDASKEIWTKFTPSQRKKLCAQIAKSFLGRELTEALVDTNEEPSEGGESSDQEESDGEQDTALVAVQAEPPPAQDSHLHHDDAVSKTRLSPDTTQSSVDPMVLKVIHDVLDNLFQLIDECPETDEPLSYLRKLQIVDSGGQPQFHEVLPIFLRRMSLIAFVFKLSEEFSSHPTIEYFENGDAVGAPYKSDHTTEQLFQQGLQSLRSHRSSKDKGCGSPQIIVLGTHKDEESKCEESREAKNQRLREILLPGFKNEIIYHHIGTKEVIFPMNAKSPGKDEEIIAKTIRTLVTKHQIHPQNLPFQWFALEIILEEITQALDRGFLSKAECLEIARRLHFDESTLEAALMYLDELSLIFYYPNILPELVFTNPQVLLDKVSELVKVHHDLMRCSGPCPGNEAAWQEFFDHGLVTEKFLSQDNFKKHYVPHLFRPKDLVLLFRKLLIFANFSSVKYFVPSLLRMLNKEDVLKHCIAIDHPASPLVLDFPDGGPCRGIFCSLICYLTSPENIFPEPWKLKMPAQSVTPDCLYRNCVKFTIHETPCTVTLIDTFSHFEAHVSASEDICKDYCPTILQCLLTGCQKAALNLGYTMSKPKPAFLCPCGEKNEAHVAHIGPRYWTCSLDEGVGGEIAVNQRIWLKSSTSELTPAGL